MRPFPRLLAITRNFSIRNSIWTCLPAFLVSLVLSTLFLAYRVFLAPSPYTFVQFFNSGLLLIGLVTLILFFATGVYSEKIVYAYKSVGCGFAGSRLIPSQIRTTGEPSVAVLQCLSQYEAAAASMVSEPSAYVQDRT